MVAAIRALARSPTAAEATGPVIGPGRGTRFRQELETRQCGGAVLGRGPVAYTMDEILGRAVVIGKVPGRGAVGDVRSHALEGLRSIDPGRARPTPATSRSGCGEIDRWEPERRNAPVTPS